ncbi:MAG: hypothetical protein HN929_00830 [Chloroflexi bacterium]|nr:hypothetical protein [Chloroflexota bacterium]MBT7080009.1 hypothetical protein [Chloroflexota bacterium]MBT7289856.1 hypothetical protein [Chloroflexota bacterium]
MEEHREEEKELVRVRVRKQPQKILKALEPGTPIDIKIKAWEAPRRWKSY